ncbi:SAM-dependent methyltransferase [Algoriphagus sp. 4150]|uniref:methyltransferase domain-containing protein n=1 Tax=Algoriphagus sp. 4150 TaxID=2817756 RepID=UPI00286200E9|nr:methyltransferase domain-containing protein [Algoriphagus sp. 4150]MDR7127720.1 SAM-dependent methyltransferase [Algoriphagus sp. 4150]
MNNTAYVHNEKVHNTEASSIIIPEIIKWIKPRSVLDVGCGIGTWLNIFSQFGVKDLMGIDGDYVDRDLLYKHIDSDDFKSCDLEKPFDLKRKFDLAISVEVAEHLKASSADIFVESICRHADTVIFSAAIPGQGGQNHINEQWPSYWEAKFKRHGYHVYDPFRLVFWKDQKIEPWYRQNILLFSKNELDIPKANCIDIVLPDFWDQKIRRIENLENQIRRIRSGRVGLGFYIKGIIKSLRYFGRKQK